MLRLSLLLSLLVASPASAVAIDWVPVGNPGNACDSQPDGCFGAVTYSYYIGAHEVTNAQYAEFLNAKAKSDPLGLYTTSIGGITRSGVSGSYSYSTLAGRENMPVNFVAFYDAARFANWMTNGQGSGDTETGAYTLLGGTEFPSNRGTVTRSAGGSIFVSNEDEWYKAAYYDSVSTSYFDFPAGTNTATVCTAPTSAPNSANCDAPGSDATDPDVDGFTPVGSYTGSPGPYATFDQGGNADEWNDGIISDSGSFRGGSFAIDSAALYSLNWRVTDPRNAFGSMGFRLVMIPEPGTGLLVIGGLLGLGGWRRRTTA